MGLQFRLLFLLLFTLEFAYSQVHQSSIEEDTSFFILDQTRLDSLGELLIGDVRFELGSDRLLDSNDVRILALVDFMLRHPTYIIELGHHTDCRGSKNTCRQISQRRAEAICNRLVALGVHKDQLIARGFGESSPVVENGILYDCNYIMQFSPSEQEAMHDKNRRIQVVILSKDFKGD